MADRTVTWNQRERSARIANRFENRPHALGCDMAVNITQSLPQPVYAAGLAAGYSEGLRDGRRGR